jgi:hypothetical protein
MGPYEGYLKQRIAGGVLNTRKLLRELKERGEGGLKATITAAAERDALWSEGKALSDREDAVLQALELLTWIKAVGLRRQVADLFVTSVEQMSEATWMEHVLKRLQLIKNAGRRRSMDGIVYAINPTNVIDMMRRYDVPIIHEERYKTVHDLHTVHRPVGS